MTNRELERRVINIEAMVTEMYASVTGKPVAFAEPTQTDIDRFCKAILRGDKDWQHRYLSRFGDRPPKGGNREKPFVASRRG